MPLTIFLVSVGWVLIGANPAFSQTNLDSALLSAAEKGETRRIRELLAAGANANAKGWADYTPLHAACGRGNLASVKLLLGAGADVNAQDKYQGQRTPLGVVAATAKVEFARELIAAGADVEKGGISPLIAAARYGRADMMKILVEAGANVNPTAKRPPLHFARSANAARALIKLGAKVDLRTKDGETFIFAAKNSAISSTLIPTSAAGALS